MHYRLVESIDAPREKVFDLVVAIIVANIGRRGDQSAIKLGSKLELRLPLGRKMVTYEGSIKAHDKPGYLALSLSNQTQSISAQFRFQDGELGETAVTVECDYELDVSRRFKFLTRRLVGRLVENKLQQLLHRVKEASASGSLPGQAPAEFSNRNYNGLVERAAPGVHEAAMKLVSKHVAQVQSSVLDLAAGSGAWLSRLHDAGFSDLDAVELNVEMFGFDAVQPRALDLNATFSQSIESSFQLVTALEIIEHLDSPRNFLRQVHSLLDDNGYLLVTTPNVGTWQGRLRFLFRAEHVHFGEWDYHNHRHISPVTDLHMDLMFREIGFRLMESVTSGDFQSRWRRIATYPLHQFFALIFGPKTKGEVNIYLATKVEPGDFG